MTDTKALRKLIEKTGLKYKSIAKFLGITPYTLQKKIDNESEFKVSEMEKITEICGLTPEEKDKIFFAKS